MWKWIVPVGSELNEGLGRWMDIESLGKRMEIGFGEEIV